MATGDVTLTRGVGYRDDATSAAGFVDTKNQTSGTVTDTLTTDGDVYTMTTVFNGSGNGDWGMETTPNIAGGPVTTTYGKTILRHKENWTGADAALLIVNYADSTHDYFSFTLSTSWKVEVYTLNSNPNKVVQSYSVQIQSTTVGLNFNTRIAQWDFVFVFKEILTLPAVSQPMPLVVQRYVVELPIPTREGGIVQDMGSQSAMIEVDGTLITTTTPNNYTGDQWWDVLVGTQLEANWQWLSSDRINYKYQIENLTPQQEPGKVGFYGFRMKLRKIDILGATAQTFGAIQ